MDQISDINVCNLGFPSQDEEGKERGKWGGSGVWGYYLIGISNQLSLKRMVIKLLPMAHKANEDQRRQY